MTKARIHIEYQRWISLVEVPVASHDNPRSILYPKINGVILVPVTDAHLFGISASSIRRLFREGKLTKYNKKGRVKRGSGSEQTFWDLHQYFQN